ncbi:hypothetical protein [Salibaculum griseiflavum]|uniref:Uncharacterized protein n=1 Tax=Salibaculum griseiflavum TaxID=1914409 RepID=A0A2V1P466_9RHOB|nr:hypothetical protein [Salibaculum griseiflavum]PWG16634.1 hypothetical protein DFK10_10870 [Salibaculum griseiflavum]
MSDDNKPEDQTPGAYSGIPWVHVEPEVARAHPKGQLTFALRVIAGYLVVIGLFKLWVFWGAGYAPGVILLGGLLPVLAGLGLWARMPWAVVVTLVMAGFNLYAFVRNVGADPGLLLLFDGIVSVGIIFYLVEGDRPNFIYRHRYRKYSVLDGNKDGD